VPHRTRSRSEEVLTVLPLGCVLLCKPKEGFMHDSRCVQRVFRALRSQQPSRYATQLVVKLRDE
jgi:hypothetical protein